jgi:GxxExxY protein
MTADERRLNEISETIIGCCYTVSNTLGAGFLEKIYENALCHELRKQGHVAEQQKAIVVKYDGVVMGEYFADVLVGKCIVVEIKTVRALDEAHRAQCLNYLKATKLKLGLVVNFGDPKVEIMRVVNRL